MIEHVVMSSDDDNLIPPETVLVITCTAAGGNLPRDTITMEACSYDENTDYVHRHTLASFSMDPQALVDALNLGMGRQAFTYVEAGDP